MAVVAGMGSTKGRGVHVHGGPFLQAPSHIRYILHGRTLSRRMMYPMGGTSGSPRWARTCGVDAGAWRHHARLKMLRKRWGGVVRGPQTCRF